MTKDASADADRATAAEPVVSALRDGILSAVLEEMNSYLANARAERRWTGFEFWLCPDLFQALSVCQRRPHALFDADVREIDTWSWGWMLMVSSSIQTPHPYEPAQAIEARRAETGTGSVHESAVLQDAPEGGQ